MSFPDPQAQGQTTTPVMPVQPPVNKGYVVLPPEVDEPPQSTFSVPFVVFAVVVFAAATVAGLVKSGRMEIPNFGAKPAPAIAASVPAAPVADQKPAPAAPAAAQAAKPVAAAASAAPTPSLPAGAFTVTSISVGNPSFAIINGQAKSVGDSVVANGATGWRVRQISESTVVLQNGSTLAELPLSTPGLTPLNDKLNPLN